MSNIEYLDVWTAAQDAVRDGIMKVGRRKSFVLPYSCGCCLQKLFNRMRADNWPPKEGENITCHKGGRFDNGLWIDGKEVYWTYHDGMWVKDDETYLGDGICARFSSYGRISLRTPYEHRLIGLDQLMFEKLQILMSVVPKGREFTMTPHQKECALSAIEARIEETKKAGFSGWTKQWRAFKREVVKAETNPDTDKAG